ncbi:adenylate/guanylate cyclase domain-containing protein [Spirulina sp. CS-785/01]|uniref:adenylate/guanylate cyclase domain-containing protein n=1 Tax=Spirulina sp. CS-785/01 TaxID=3021716 RepID=UPI00232EF35A|nr:adenylate/guanylate cyclase domain-containing protein [Spirulina sp. CS-785/01]MDB9312406.1 adenylate/guanylate cyclase domain-containing protein [Spirulina sp. CS-785/01]
MPRFGCPQKLPLRWVIIAPMILQISTAVGVVGWLSWRSGQRTVIDLATRLSTQVSQQIDKQVRNYLNTSELVLKVNQTAVETGNLKLNNFQQLERYFWEQTQLTEFVSTLFYGSAEGEFLQVEQSEPPTVSIRTQETAPNWEVYQLNDQGERIKRVQVKEYDPRTRPWYENAVKSGGLTWSLIYVFIDPPVLGITPAIPIYQSSGELQGVMAIDLPLSQIGEFLSSLEISQSGEAFIIDRQGDLVASSTSELPFAETVQGRTRLPATQSNIPSIRLSIQALQDRWGDLEEVGNYQTIIEDEQGNRYFLQITSLRNDQGIDWLLGIVIPEADFQAEIAANRRTTMVICAIALFVATTLGFITSRWIIQPILHLVKATQAIAQNHLDQRVPTENIRELDTLARSFNKMAIELRETFTAWEEMNISLEQLVAQRSASLKVSEERFSKAFRSSPDPIAISTLEEGCFIEVNQSFLEVTGYHPQDIIGKTAAEINLWTNRRDRARIVRELRSQGRVLNQEMSFRSATDEFRTVRLSAELLQLNDEQCILWVANDITQRKQAEAALREKEEYLRLILDNIPQQVFWKDTNCVFLGCNQNWARAAQLPNPEAVIGKTDFDLLDDPQLAESFQTEDRHVMETDQATLHKIARKIRPGENGEEVWLDISKIPLHNASGEVIGLIGVIEDITLRRQATEALKLEQKKSEALLVNILPQDIVEQLKQQQSTLPQPGQKTLIAQHYEEATILFADIVGFTPLSAQLLPIELIDLLNEIFSAFDHLLDRYQLEKIKTIGDAYMVAAGLPIPRADHVDAIAKMALEMQAAIGQFYVRPHEPCRIRIGIHTGSVVAGVIGIKKFIYDLWGDTVNVASRMESTGYPNKIQVTEAIYQRLKDRYTLEKRGTVKVKGKGEMTTYWLLGKR